LGPAILITIGVLFLLDQVTHIYWMEFGRTWPALLIVTGLILFLQHNAPATGHLPREYTGVPQAMPAPQWQQGQTWQPPVTQQPPASQQPPAAAPSAGTSDQGEVHHG
jgi:hypothetical protein